MVTGVTVSLGGKKSSDADKESKDIMKDLNKDGI
jgi:hypothetical protein